MPNTNSSCKWLWKHNMCFKWPLFHWLIPLGRLLTSPKQSQLQPRYSKRASYKKNDQALVSKIEWLQWHPSTSRQASTSADAFRAECNSWGGGSHAIIPKGCSARIVKLLSTHCLLSWLWKNQVSEEICRTITTASVTPKQWFAASNSETISKEMLK